MASSVRYPCRSMPSSPSSPEIPPRPAPGLFSDPFDRTVASWCEEHHLLPPGPPVIVAVSGGGDSVALLHWILRLPTERRVIVAHLDHRLRGDESRGDSLFVQRLARKWGVEARVASVDVGLLAHQRRLSVEEAGREARYAFFASLRRETGGVIAVAHHADDQAETVLMRLVRGAGGKGLAGIPPVDPRGVVRPFLPVTRDQIVRYRNRWEIPCRHDRTNDDPDHSLRNRIRHRLMPLLREYNPRIVQRLVDTARILADDERFLEEMARRQLDGAALLEEGRLSLRWGALSPSPSLRRRVIRECFSRLAGSSRGLGAEHVEACLRLADGVGGGEITLPAGLLFQVSEGIASFVTPSAPVERGARLISGIGSHHLWEGVRVEITPVGRTGGPLDFSRQTVVDLCRFPFPWRVRTRTGGERIRIEGVGRRKLKKILAEKGIPRWERNHLPLFESGGETFWVPGVVSAKVGGEGDLVLVEIVPVG